MEEIEHRVLKVVSAYDKVTADKVNSSLQESINLACFVLLFLGTLAPAGQQRSLANAIGAQLLGETAIVAEAYQRACIACVEAVR